MVHVNQSEAPQPRPSASDPGLAADREPTGTLSSDQPQQYESDVVLRDGSTLRLRPVRPGDREGVLALHNRLSRKSLRSRFFGIPSSTDGEVSRLLRAEQEDEFVLVAEAGKRLEPAGQRRLPGRSAVRPQPSARREHSDAQDEG